MCKNRRLTEDDNWKPTTTPAWKQGKWTNGPPSEVWTPWRVDYSRWEPIYHIFLKSSDSLQKTVQLEDKLWLENRTYEDNVSSPSSTLCGPWWIQIMTHSQNRFSSKEISNAELLPTSFDSSFAHRLFTLLSADLNRDLSVTVSSPAFSKQPQSDVRRGIWNQSILHEDVFGES